MERISNQQIIRVLNIYLSLKQDNPEWFNNASLDDIIDKIQDSWNNLEYVSGGVKMYEIDIDENDEYAIVEDDEDDDHRFKGDDVDDFEFYFDVDSIIEDINNYIGPETWDDIDCAYLEEICNLSEEEANGCFDWLTENCIIKHYKLIRK